VTPSELNFHPGELIGLACWLFISAVIGVMYRDQRGMMRAGGAFVAATGAYVLGSALLRNRLDWTLRAGVGFAALCACLYFAAGELAWLLPKRAREQLDEMARRRT